MLQYHDPIELMPGDSWAIPGVLTDIDGDPLDLTTATLEWSLVDYNGKSVASALITVDAPSTDGKLTITIPKTVTVNLNPGYYTDVLRVTVPGAGTQTVWRGTVMVAANRFAT
jgi:hypothetical protein